MQPVEPTLHEEKVVHIFKLRDHCLCADTAPVAQFKEGSERNLQKEEISLMNLHSHNFPHLHDEITHYDNNSFGKA
jgi:hypothetical protein